MSDTVEQVEALSLPLVNRFYKACRYSAKAGRGDMVFVLKREGSIVAALKLVPKNDGHYFLRSMCVAPECRGQGVGTRLLREIEGQLNAFPVFCYPFSHLQDFYAQIGFMRRDESDVVDFIRDPYQRYRQQGRDIIIMTRPAPLEDDVNV